MVLDNGVGVRLISDNSIISDNTFYRNPLGILADTSGSTISRNVVVESKLNITHPEPELFIFYYPEWLWEYSVELVQMEIGGIIVGGGYNIIDGNAVRDSYYGLVMYDMIRSIWGSGNLVFHNNFIDNTFYQIIGAPRASNNYDNGYPSGGNYWSNYNGTDFYNGPNQNETDSDGICDTAFLVFSEPQCDVIDNYPLTAPVEIFDAGTWNSEAYSADIVSNSTLSDFKLDVAQKTLSFNVTGIEGKAGFCRITIPNAIVEDLWQGNFTVLLNGELWPFRSWTDHENTYMYINYTHSEHEIIIIPEFPPTVILPLFMILSIIAIVFAKKNAEKRSLTSKTLFFNLYKRFKQCFELKSSLKFIFRLFPRRKANCVLTRYLNLSQTTITP